MLKRHIVYLKDNPKGYWFKRKLYGWGSTPATWQGWAVIGIFVVLIVVNSLRLGENPGDKDLIWFFCGTIVLVCAVTGICYKTGMKMGSGVFCRM